MLDSPIRGWLRNASSQSDSVRLCQISSDATRRAASSDSGLRAEIPSAQAREPQHGIISFTAAATGRQFQRANTLIIGLPARARSSQLLEEFRNQVASHGGAVFRSGSNIVNGLDRSAGHSP